MRYGCMVWMHGVGTRVCAHGVGSWPWAHWCGSMTVGTWYGSMAVTGRSGNIVFWKILVTNQIVRFVTRVHGVNTNCRFMLFSQFCPNARLAVIRNAHFLFHWFNFAGKECGGID